jgi:hypothetical protein
VNKAKGLLRGASFESQTIDILVQAFDLACKQMQDKGQPDIVYDTIARRIVEIAEAGERDVSRLAEGALSPVIGRCQLWTRLPIQKACR